MAITAAEVKKLRDATGAGMMDAKKALTEADGDFDKAVDILRVSGAAKAAKRSDREASNGLVAAAGSSLVHIGSETDFVAKNEEFIAAANEIAEAVEKAGADSKDAANAAVLADGTAVGDKLGELAAKIGEKIELANAAHFAGNAHVYLHRRSQDLPPQVGVMVEYEGDNAEAVHGVCLQIAAMSPRWLSRDDVPADVVEHERTVAADIAREEGKPEKIIDRIVEGRLGGFFKENCLLDQPAISDDKKTITQTVKAAGVTIKRFVRFSAGE
ncbi:translation elongation factor Ts [Cutibacterium modestum]|uniref:translation elongation factor Ts n=1 Tax=Cutibacterium modestum TaxID=2559073 RepID=UPI000F06D2C4|nr:translation elongation factor Ts [Cutibacterium modestum]MCP2377323.1 elongation factor Ts [Cutibacterium modestum 31N]